jgi:hypothetical protein
MYARVTTTPISPYRLEEAISLARDSTMPAASKQAGFKGYLMLVDMSAGMAITITFWQDEDDREISGPNSDYYKDSIAKIVPLLTGAPVVEDFEVALQVYTIDHKAPKEATHE